MLPDLLSGLSGMYCVCRPQPVKASGAAAASHPDSSEQAGFRPVGASLAPDGTPIMPVSGLHARSLQIAQAVQPQAVGLEAWVLCVIGDGRTLPSFHSISYEWTGRSSGPFAA